jgi:hypothetical protein
MDITGVVSEVLTSSVNVSVAAGSQPLTAVNSAV